MSGGRDPVGGSIREMDDRRGALLSGATEGTGTVHGVRVVDDGGIFWGAHDDTAYASGRGDTELGKLGHGGRDADLSHGLTDQGRPVELLGGGMHRTSGDEDSNAGPFYTPACPGHRVHFGGGKPLPPTVPPMQHAIPLVYTERKVP